MAHANEPDSCVRHFLEKAIGSLYRIVGNDEGSRVDIECDDFAVIAILKLGQDFLFIHFGTASCMLVGIKLQAPPAHSPSYLQPVFTSL